MFSVPCQFTYQKPTLITCQASAGSTSGEVKKLDAHGTISHRKAGGAGLVDIYDYLWAVRLDHIKYWLCSQETPL